MANTGDATGKQLYTNSWIGKYTQTGNEGGRQMFANAVKADANKWSPFDYSVRVKKTSFFFFIPQQSTPTHTYSRLTFQSTVVKAVRDGCKKSSRQSVHLNIYITLPEEFWFFIRLLQNTPALYTPPCITAGRFGLPYCHQVAFEALLKRWLMSPWSCVWRLWE